MINDCFELFELNAKKFRANLKGAWATELKERCKLWGAQNLHNFLYDMYQTALRWAESFLRFHEIGFVASWSGRGVVTPPILTKPIVSSW